MNAGKRLLIRFTCQLFEKPRIHEKYLRLAYIFCYTIVAIPKGFTESYIRGGEKPEAEEKIDKVKKIIRDYADVEGMLKKAKIASEK